MYDGIVIGGGFAGLSAAVEMSRRGGRVLVLEAAPRLGGRATAFEDRETGELVDNGQHVLFGCYHETFRFLEAIGASEHVALQATLQASMIDLRGRRSVLRCPALPAPLHLLGGILDWDALPLADRLSAVRLMAPLRRARQRLEGREAALPASPGETVSTWLHLHGQAPRLCELLWEPLALAALNQPADQAGALPFTRVLAGLFGTDRRDAAIGLPLRPLHLMYAEPARAFLHARGSRVRTGARARLVTSGDRVEAVEAGGERYGAAAVIAAVPWFSMAGLFAQPPPALGPVLDGAAAMRSSPIVTVNLWLDRPVLEEPLLGLPGRAFQWVFDKRLAFGPEASHLSFVASGAGTLVPESNTALVGRAFEELRAALPAARRARLRRATVVREKRATFSLAPGQPTRPSCGTPVSGLFLAGDWIDTGLPGTIESAVVSGHRAAELATAGR